MAEELPQKELQDRLLRIIFLLLPPQPSQPCHTATRKVSSFMDGLSFRSIR